jgi:choline dehydrogenase-like flavoprotein
VESGGLEADRATQALAAGDNVGLPYFPLVSTRLRLLGGTTDHWGGHCRPFEPMDFETRDWVPGSGWPLTKNDLDPYYARGHVVCRIEMPDYDVATWERKSARPCLAFPGGRVVTRIGQLVFPPSDRRWGRVYRDEFARSASVTTLLNANVTEIVTDEAGRSVMHLEVKTLAGNAFTVAASQYVLAAGGIDNPRLMLASNRRQPAGIGNHNDLVGRYFLEHPRMLAGVFLPANQDVRLRLYENQLVAGAMIRGYLALDREVQRAERLLDVQLRLDPSVDAWAYARHLPSVHSARQLLRGAKHGRVPDHVGKHLGHVLADLDGVAFATYVKMMSRRDESFDRAPIVARVEPVPNPASRVTLSTDRDAVGVPRPRLDWRLSPLDKQSLRRTMEIFAVEVGKQGLGRVRIDLDADHTSWPEDMEGGWHHMGTTRMHPDPKQGVVDADCRVHGIANLYVAGSSVFPTAGSGTPTLTIVALALRLADHLKSQEVRR